MVLGFLASHGGSSMKAIVRAVREGRLLAGVGPVISNNSKSEALCFARAEGAAAFHLSEFSCGGPDQVDQAILDALVQHGVTHVILSGYMKKIGPRTLRRYPGRILNTHPALLPRFGGQGMYGEHVHAAVLASGERTTGVTIHLVDEHYDHGSVVSQTEVPVLPGDTVQSLGERVRAREASFFVAVLQALASE